MAFLIEEAKPGNLIRASEFNEMRLAIVDIYDRLARLETGPTTGLTITSVSASSRTVGEELVLLGRNFGYVSGATRVTVGNQPAALKFGSSDSMLIFDIPDLGVLPDSGAPVEVKVVNRDESDRVTITVHPAPLFGGVDVTFVTTDPAPVPTGAPVKFNFTITSRASGAADYTLTPTVSVPAWQSGLSVFGDPLSATAQNKIRLNAGQSKPFFVLLTSIPGGTPALTPFTLTVTALAAGTGGTTGPLPFNVGATASVDPDVLINVGSMDPNTALVGDTIQLSASQTGTLTLSATFKSKGTYNLTDPATLLSPAAAKWQVLPTLFSQMQYVISDADIAAAAGAGVQRPIEYTIASLVGADASGNTVTFRLQEASRTINRSRTFQLRVVP